MKKSVVKKIVGMMFTSVLALAAGCGGGGGGGGGTSTPNTVTGVAAAGAVIAGTVTLKDSATPAKELTKTTTTTDGSYSFDVTGLTKPFMLRVVPTAGATPTLYSLIGDKGVANINPMTNLVVAKAAAGADLATMYGASGAPLAANVAIAAGKLDSAVVDVRASLKAILQPYGAQSVNPITDAYRVDGTGLDGMLDDYTVVVTNGTVTVSSKSAPGTPVLTADLKNNGLATFTVSGKITTPASAGLPQITVNVTDTASPQTVYGTAVTAADGSYTISGVPQVGYTVSPVWGSHTYDHISVPVAATAAVANNTVNFQGAALNTLSGTVQGSNGNGLAGVTLAAYAAGTTAPLLTYVVSDAKGGFTFNNMQKDQKYDVYPAMMLGTINGPLAVGFDASFKSATVDNANTATVSFAAAVPTFTVQGDIVNDKAVAMSNVSVSLGIKTGTSGGSAVYQVRTDAAGHYVISGVPGSYYSFSLTYKDPATSKDYLFAWSPHFVVNGATMDNMQITSDSVIDFTGSIPPAGGIDVPISTQH
jgi:hypothetical protein